MSSILESYFNDLNLADLNGQGSWSGDASFDVSTAGAKEGRRGVENADTSGSNKDISKTGSQRNDGRIAIYLKRTNTTGQTLLVLNEGANERVAVGLGNDGHIKYKNSSGSFVNLGADTTYSANTWYLLEVEWRSSDHKIRILVDGVQKQDWVSPYANWTSYLDKVVLRVNQTAGTSYWDYISEFGTSIDTSNWSYKKKYKIDHTKIDEDLTDFQVLVKIDNTKPNYQHFFDNAGTDGASVRFVSTLETTKWSYRKKITLTGQSGAGTGYQVFLKVGESSGSTGADFHLGGHSADFPSAKNDGGDLRFTDNDGTTLLPFWVEEVTGTSPNRVAKVWVKVKDDLGSNVDIYCYYGNSSASNASNGNDTFLLFDDFDGTSLDTSKWGVYGSAGSQVSNGVLNTQGSGEGLLYSKWYPTQSAKYIFRFKIGGTGYKHFSYAIGQQGGETLNTLLDFFYTFYENGTTYYYSGGWKNGITRIKRSIETNDVIDVQYEVGSTTWKFYKNGTFLDTLTQSVNCPSAGIGFRTYGSTEYEIIDYTFVRKYASTEPSYNTAGSEESGNYLTLENPLHLKFEKVRFDAANKKAEYFVKIPSVSSTTDTYFYLLYGRTGALDGSDKTEVYGDEFKAVYHMKDDPDTSHIKDSTINGNNGTKKAANEPIEADGKVAKAQSFDGSNDYIDTFNIPVMSTFSFSSLVKLDTIKDCGIITDNKSGYFYPAYSYRIDANGKVGFDFHIGNGGGSYQKTVTSISTLSAGQWYYLIATYDGSSLKIYINGSLDNSASVTGTPWNNTAVAVMGASSVAGGSPISYFDGLIDETNIVATNLSASYIKAQYNSLFDTLIKEQLFILANTGSYALTGINTAIKRSYSLISQAGSYALTGINVALGFFRKLFANAGSYSLTGFDVALYLHTVYNLILSAGSYTLTGINTGLKALRRLVSLAGSYTLTGISAGLFRAYTFILSRGSYALTGIDILFRKGYAVMCETGELVLTGVDTLLRALRKLALSRGSYTLTGINTILKALRKLITNTGSYILTGVDTVLKAFRKLVSSVGSYVLTGIGAGLGAFRKMMVDAGSYTLTGIATGLNRLYTFIISAGSYALTGIEAIFYKAYVLIASVGSYILTGTKAKLTAWIKEILHSATWTKEDTHNTIWHKE